MPPLPIAGTAWSAGILMPLPIRDAFVVFIKKRIFEDGMKERRVSE